MADPALFTTVENNDFLPFGGFRVPNGDDNVASVSITPVFENGFTIGDRTPTEIIVATNGGVSFGGGVSFPYVNPFSSTPQIAILPTDLDTRFPDADNPRAGVFVNFNEARDSVVIT